MQFYGYTKVKNIFLLTVSPRNAEFIIHIWNAENDTPRPWEK